MNKIKEWQQDYKEYKSLVKSRKKVIDADPENKEVYERTHLNGIAELCVKRLKKSIY